jgi:hypothetical protein
MIVESEPDEDDESGVPGRDESPESRERVEVGVWITVDRDPDEDVGVKVPLYEVLRESVLLVEDGVRIPPDEDELAAGVSKGFNDDEPAEGVWITPDTGAGTDPVYNPSAPLILIPLTAHHSMYSS